MSRQLLLGLKNYISNMFIRFFIVFLQVLVGNSDSETVVKHGLTPPIKARYIRLTPTAWNVHISMRMELYGCLGNWPFNPTLKPNND